MPLFAVARRIVLLFAALAGGLLACAALLAVLAQPARAAGAATVLTYPGAAPCDLSLQECLDGAAPGDTINILPGVYSTSVTLNRAISLTGASSADVILRALPGQRVLTVTGAAVSNSVVISGLTFAGGDISADVTCPDHCGGGVLVNGTAQPLLVGVVITGNQAGRGGGLYAASDSLVRLRSVQVLSNASAADGPGAWVGATTAVEGGLFQGNKCTDTNCWGGGLFSFNGLVLTDVHFISNTASLHGGGFYAMGSVVLNGGLVQNNRCTDAACLGGGAYANVALHVSGTQFISNTSHFIGGGAYANYTTTLEGALFQGNQCLEDNCWGGGVAVLSVNPVLVTNTQFISNTSQNGGGGLYYDGGEASIVGALFQGNQCLLADCNGGGLYASGPLAVDASRFLANQAGEAGGAVAETNSPDGRVTNSLFAGNTAPAGAALWLVSSNTSLVNNTIAMPSGQHAGSAIVQGSGTARITNTIFANYAAGLELQSGGGARQDYNLFDNVLLAAPGASGGANSLTGLAAFAAPGLGDYRLTLASDALDNGADGELAVDFFGNPRPAGPGVDIGYHELLAADLFVSKAVNTASAEPGDVITYTIVVSNAGPAGTSALVSDPLPAGLTGAAWTCQGVGGAVCPAGGAGDISATVTLSAGTHVQFTLQATLAPEASGAITNTASAAPAGGVVDPTPGDSSASAVVQAPVPQKLYLPLVRRSP